MNIRTLFLLWSLVVMTQDGFAADEIHWTITGQTSVTFDWRGTNAENTISYGTSPGVYTGEVIAVTPNPLPISSSGPFWEAKITGLQEGTLYYYAIGNEFEQTFRTPPPRGSSNFTVHAEGDISSSLKTSRVSSVQALIANDLPHFVLVAGDLTYGNSGGGAVVDQHFNDVMVWSQDAAYMPAWGNHEWAYSTDDLRNYKGRFDVPNPQTSPGSPAVSCCGEDWNWFDYGNVRFIAYPEPYTSGTTWPDWNTHAQALMNAAQADPVIDFIVTFGHQPAYSSGYHSGSSTLKGILDALGDSHSKYVLNVNAHSHDYERSFPQHGVVHVTVGTGGASLETSSTSCLFKICPAPAYTAARFMHHGATRLRFTDTGIEGTFICGPAQAGKNDITCNPGDMVDAFVIGTPIVDTAPPTTVSITVPASPVSGTITVSATASDNVGVAGVQFKLDGNPLGAEDTSALYAISWNTTLISNGEHTLTAEARDAAGNKTTSNPVLVTVDNPVDTTPPTVSITAPVSGATVSGTATLVSADALDTVGVVGVQFQLDGNPLGAEDTTSPYAISWNTTQTPNGPYTLTAVARDAAGNMTTSNPVLVTVVPLSSIDVRVSNSSDDAEQVATTGAMSLTSSDLELILDAADQAVGMRFNTVAIPQGASITNAYIQFQADETSSTTTALQIGGQAADNPPAFTTTAFNISSRPKTAASVSWTPAAWPTVGAAGIDQRTPDIKTVIQEIVSRTGWASGNSLAVIITGSGKRVAEAFDGVPSAASLLHVEYTASGEPGNIAPAVNIAAPANDSTFAAGASITFTGTADDPENGDLTATMSWTSSLDGAIGSGGSFSKVLTTGTHTITASVTDTGSLAGSASIMVTVNPPGGGNSIEVRVSNSSDDAEQVVTTGSMKLTSSDLEMTLDGTTEQTVGLRFNAITIPKGATITNAYLQFTVDETPSAATTLQIGGQAADNPPTFTTAKYDISSRPRATDPGTTKPLVISWIPAAWPTVGAAGIDQRTPDIKAVIQEIVNRSGWASGNSLAVIITGTGKRVAEAFNGVPSAAPLLHVDYSN